MREEQKKQLEMQLRRLFESAGQSQKNAPARQAKRSGGIRVIRRRSGRPDHHILEGQKADNQSTTIKKTA